MSYRIGIIRGSRTNRSEIANYEPIARDHDITILGARGTTYTGPLPYKTYFSPASVKNEIASKATRAAVGYFMGAESTLFGLTEDLRGYDVVHTAETFNGFSKQAVDAKRDYGCSVVCTVWENIPHYLEKNHYSSVLRQRIAWSDATSIKSRVRREVDAFLPVTEHARFALETEGVDPSKIHVVPIGVDTKMFQPGKIAASDRSPEAFDLSSDSLNVVFVGRTPWEKGVYDLLSAWQTVESDAERSIALTIIGADDNLERLRSFKETLGIRDVHIREPVPYEDMPLVMDAADILVLPSIPTRRWQEQYGRVILEAQACETVVVASNTGGIPEAMGGIGRLVRPGDAEDIAAEILSLVDNDEERVALAREGRTRIEQERTLADTALRVSDIYELVA